MLIILCNAVTLCSIGKVRKKKEDLFFFEKKKNLGLESFFFSHSQHAQQNKPIWQRVAQLVSYFVIVLRLLLSFFLSFSDFFLSFSLSFFLSFSALFPASPSFLSSPHPHITPSTAPTVPRKRHVLLRGSVALQQHHRPGRPLPRGAGAAGARQRCPAAAAGVEAAAGEAAAAAAAAATATATAATAAAAAAAATAAAAAAATTARVFSADFSRLASNVFHGSRFDPLLGEKKQNYNSIKNFFFGPGIFTAIAFGRFGVVGIWPQQRDQQCS